MNIDIVFAQFGDKRSILEPSLSSFKKYFPDARVVLYTDEMREEPSGCDIIKQFISPFDKQHQRYGHRSNDLFKGIGMLESNADFVLALDSDMLAISDKVTKILFLVKKFGLCLPLNPRYMVLVDNTIGADSDGEFDETAGCGLITNMSPIAFSTSNFNARLVIKKYMEEITYKPVRGPIAMWRAIWATGYFPCILPPQWCVCWEHCGIGNEIVLHVGHDQVKNYYHV